MVGALHLGAGDTGEVLRLAKEQHYQLACTRHFESTHPGYSDMGVKTVSINIYITPIDSIFNCSALERRSGKPPEPVVRGVSRVRACQERRCQ
jgi:hypothetical protein